MAYITDPTLENLTDEDLEQLIADARAEQTARFISALAETTKTDVQTFIDSKSGLVARGCTAIADAKDGSWVVIQFPTDDPQTLSGDKLALVLGGLAECVRGYGAQWVIPGKSIRNRAEQMKSNLGAIEDAIQAASA